MVGLGRPAPEFRFAKHDAGQPQTVIAKQSLVWGGGCGIRTHRRLLRPSQISNLLQYRYANPP